MKQIKIISTIFVLLIVVSVGFTGCSVKTANNHTAAKNISKSEQPNKTNNTSQIVCKISNDTTTQDSESFKTLSDLETIRLYGSIGSELRDRKIIRTKNIVGDIGEYLAIEYYTNSKILTNLKATQTGNKNIDATSQDGKIRYSIKSTTTGKTGSFYGLPKKGSVKPIKQQFDYLIVVEFDENYQLDKIIELTWNQFTTHKQWNSRMNNWYINLTKKLLNESKHIK